jgi:hypothetical protein
MKKLIIVVAVMIGLVACGDKKGAPPSSSQSSTKVQQGPASEQNKGLNGFLGGGPRSTKIVKPEEPKK